MQPKLLPVRSFLLFVLFFISAKLYSQTVDMPGPAGSGAYGTTVTVLANGNYVITDTKYSEGGVNNIGAVYLYNGSTHALISTLKGSTENDMIGYDVFILRNGNYVVSSPSWHNGNAANAGAATWCDGNTGLNGIVSSANSLVGTSTNDRIGTFLYELSNGNYVLSSLRWSNGSLENAGAVTWADGTKGITGVVSSSNSLIGSSANDYLGLSIAVLANGNYVVGSEQWHNGSIQYAGAATWCNGTTGLTGTVTAGNSFIGVRSNAVGSSVLGLSNGNYLILSGGAVTWGNGQTGITGTIDNSNSWNANDIIDAIVLPNGNYLVRGQINGEISVTWANGSTGVIEARTTSNSFLSGLNVMPMFNGAYVLCNPFWDGNKGAAILCKADGSTVGTFTYSNSLVGTDANDYIGSGGVTPLLNNNFVVSSPNWNGKRGAATLCQSDGSTVGSVSFGNSLVGTNPNDSVGCGTSYYTGRGAIGLTNGNYVVNSWRWNNKRGAVTWGNGQTGVTGSVNEANSLVGVLPGDKLGLGGVFRLQNAAIPLDTNYYFNGVLALGNGNYTIGATYWNGNNGAVAWGNGKSGTTGTINNANAFIGVSNANNPTGNASYVVSVIPTATLQETIYDGTNVDYYYYDNATGNGSYSGSGQLNITLKNRSNNYIIQGVDSISKKTTVTWGNGTGGTTGIATFCNSVFGNPVDPYPYKRVAFDSVYNYLLVCRSDENIVTRFYPAVAATAPDNIDNNTLTIAGSSPVVFPTTTGCGQIAALTASGSNPVSGVVTAKTWLEATQPTYYVARHYEITPAVNASTSTGTITLYFTQADFDGFNNQSPAPNVKLPTGPTDAAGIANILVQKEAGVSGVGTGLPGTYPGPVTVIDPDDNNIVWNSAYQRWEVSFDVNGFSGFFIITKTASALPLQLLNFSGTRQGSSNLLQWKTAHETGTSLFELQSSTNGNSFGYVGSVAASGAGKYSFIDQHPMLGRTYYRLKIIDVDGRFTYSNIILIKADGNQSVNLYPNPVVNTSTLDIGGSSALIGTQAQLKDGGGRILRQFTISNNQVQINMEGVAAGLYFLQLKDGTVLKLLKQ